MSEVKRYYVEDGNTVRKIYEPLPSLEERREKEKERRKRDERRRNNRKAKAMREYKLSMIYICAGIVAFGLFFGAYVYFQISVQETGRNVANLEEQISDLKAKNMAETNRINAAANLDTVKDAAINKIGMNYATPANIVYYKVKNDDFMSQYKDIP